MSNKFDLFVIGTGVAGGRIASALGRAGKKVGICDYKEYGGTCGLRGCNPKKVLTSAAEAQARLQAFQEIGAITGETAIDWGKLIQFKEEFVEGLPGHKRKAFTRNSVKMYQGVAKFIDRNKLQIGDEVIESEIIVIATGATPRKLNILGEELLITSEEFMNLPSLPAEILFVGGGIISFEFGYVANQAGSQVTILESMSRSLNAFEPELADLLINNFEENGIKIEKDTAVVSIKKQGDKFQVEAKSGKIFTADLVVHGAGRVPYIDELDLEKGDIEIDLRGIALNPNMQSISNSGVYVVGDAVGNPHSLPLTPVATLEARILIDNLLNDKKQVPNYAGTPSVLFTFPPLARVGMLEADAEKQGIDYSVSFGDTSEMYSTKRLGLKVSGYKIIVRKDNSKIIGAHLLGHHVDEVINLFALAIRNEFSVERLKDNLWSYPSVSDSLDEMLWIEKE